MTVRLRPITDVRYLVVHCAATPPNMDIGRKEIDLWHRRQGWVEIGYHFVIRRDGTLEAGRSTQVRGSHAAGFNEISYGICLVGGVDKAGATGKPEANYTPEQMRTLAAQLRNWQALWPKAEIVGHRDLPSPHARLKACPSFDVRAWVAAGMPDRPIP